MPTRRYPRLAHPLRRIPGTVRPAPEPGGADVTQHTHGKLLLMTLTQRTSSKGNPYMVGILNGLSVIGFRGEDNEWGETWNVYLQERQPQPQMTAQDSGQRRPS